MSPRNDNENHWPNGSVKIEPIPRPDWTKTEADHLIEAKYKIRWEPPCQIACQLPDGFTLEFECWVGKGGGRRFVPVKHLPAFISEASLTGHALLVAQGKAEETVLSYHEARLFIQFSRHTREYLGETLQIGNLLYVSKAGRLAPSAQDILPDDIGLNADEIKEQWDAEEDEKRRWSTVQFKDVGIEAAKAADFKKVVQIERICGWMTDEEFQRRSDELEARGFR